jgi:hypothetical protein
MTDNPFAALAGLGGAARSFWGPSEDERILERKLGAVREKDETEQARLEELGAVWSKMVEDAGGDVNIAQKQFIQSPEFFRLGGDSVQTMLKTFKEITDPAKPVVVGEGAALTTPEGRELYKNPKLREPKDVTETEETKALTKRGIDILGKIADDGPAAQEDIQSIAQLRSSIKDKGSFITGIRGLAAQWGIPTGRGTSDLQVAQALIDRLAPKQRVPGSGSSSDKDVAGFKRSLPSLFISDVGNQTILDGLESLAQARLNASQIASKPFTSDAGWKATMKELQEMESPLSRFRSMRIEKGDVSDLTDTQLEAAFDAPSASPSVRRAILNELKRREGKR